MSRRSFLADEVSITDDTIMAAIEVVTKTLRFCSDLVAQAEELLANPDSENYRWERNRVRLQNAATQLVQLSSQGLLDAHQCRSLCEELEALLIRLAEAQPRAPDTALTHQLNVIGQRQGLRGRPCTVLDPEWLLTARSHLKLPIRRIAEIANVSAPTVRQNLRELDPSLCRRTFDEISEDELTSIITDCL